MKKKLIILLMFIVLFFPVYTYASSVNIETFNSYIDIKENGDFDIKEDFIFTGGKKNNGVYRIIKFDNADKIENLKIKSSGKDFKEVNKAKKGDSYVYTKKINDKKEELKIYMPWSEKINVDISYTIPDVAIKGKDEGIISYNFLSDMDTDLKQFNGRVHINSYDFKNSEVLVNKGISSKIEDGDLVLSADNLKEDDSITFMASVPLKFINKATHSINENLEEFAQAKKLHIPYNIINIMESILVFITIAAFYKGKKNNSEKAIGEKIYLTPAQAASFIKGYNDITDSIIATLFDFERRGILSIEKSYYEKKDKKRDNFVFKKSGKTDGMIKSEKYLYDKLFGDSEYFSTRKLNKERKNDPYTFNKIFAGYIDIITNELQEKKVQKKFKLSALAGIAILMVSILVFIMSIINVVSGYTFSIINMIISIAIFIISIKIIGVESPFEKEQKKYYKDLYNKLKKLDIEEFNALSQDEKSELIVYAIAFGIKEDDIERLTEDLGYDLNYLSIMYLFSINREMNRSLVGNENGVTSFTSNISGGSGFTGGGSAGGF